MKNKYKGITIPYYYYDKKRLHTYFIYKNKEYTDLAKVLNAFLGTQLTYHYNIEKEENEVHNLSDVLYAICQNPKEFSIPNKYKKEYSPREYEYIKGLKESILNNKLKVEYMEEELSPNLFTFWERKQYQLDKEFKEKYNDLVIPKRVRSNITKQYYYAVGGECYETIYHALEAVYYNSFYYSFGGTKRINDRTHFHSHNFTELIVSVFNNNQEFKIHKFQMEDYSNQELQLLETLANKLKEKGFESVHQQYDQLDLEEYKYLKDNHKLISLLIYNIKWTIKDYKYKKEVLKSHKI